MFAKAKLVGIVLISGLALVASIQTKQGALEMSSVYVGMIEELEQKVLNMQMEHVKMKTENAMMHAKMQTTIAAAAEDHAALKMQVMATQNCADLRSQCPQLQWTTSPTSSPSAGSVAGTDSDNLVPDPSIGPSDSSTGSNTGTGSDTGTGSNIGTDSDLVVKIRQVLSQPSAQSTLPPPSDPPKKSEPDTSSVTDLAIDGPGSSISTGSGTSTDSNLANLPKDAGTQDLLPTPPSDESTPLNKID